MYISKCEFMKRIFFIRHIHNYTEYNQQWNLCSAFNPSKCTHSRSSGQPMLRRPGSSWGFGASLKGLTSVVELKMERMLVIHSPHRGLLPELRFEPTTSGHKSQATTATKYLISKCLLRNAFLSCNCSFISHNVTLVYISICDCTSHKCTFIYLNSLHLSIWQTHLFKETWTRGPGIASAIHYCLS